MVDWGYTKWLMENSRKTPCYQCEGRYPKCHSECKQYLEFKSVKEKESGDLRKRNDWQKTHQGEKNFKGVKRYDH